MPRKGKSKNSGSATNARRGYLYEVPVRLTIQVYGKGCFLSLQELAEGDLKEATQQAILQEGFPSSCYYENPFTEGDWLHLKVLDPILVDGLKIDHSNCRSLFMEKDPDTDVDANSQSVTEKSHDGT
jgi:hypothetical protein